MVVHVLLSLEARAEARLLMFSHMNLLSPAIGDPISIPTQDMFTGLYVLMDGDRRDICINRYNPWNRKNYQNKRSNNNKYTKELFFSNSYDAIGAYLTRRHNHFLYFIYSFITKLRSFILFFKNDPRWPTYRFDPKPLWSSLATPYITLLESFYR
ncbi:DNA-directed RNA polymerase subunit beta' [Phtheirospermum japonicum]|uniref:DNA-directed RNA polymerase n=1 Tax=Phtheirospermum japonicum TaxID=374723 RepID=A0A830CY54_9LAMI|nr:DNA-directed RNA polymerase subunit beta' [Phtheirospermum japonicum]